MILHYTEVAFLSEFAGLQFLSNFSLSLIYHVKSIDWIVFYAIQALNFLNQHCYVHASESFTLHTIIIYP